MGVWAYPAFLLMNTGRWPLVTLSLVVGQLLFAAMYGPQAAFFSELFSARVRYTGASLGYQLGVMVGGAFTPILATWLYARYESFVPVAGFLALAAAVSCVCVLVLSETYREDPSPTPADPDTEPSLTAR